MAKTNLWSIKQELCVFLRNQDILSTSIRGVTTQQDTGTFSDNSSHTLATSPTQVKNVRNVEVASADLNFGSDYTVDYSTGVISFTPNVTGDYVIDYDTGTTDRIFPDFPQADLKLNAFPRIGFDIISGKTEENSLGAQSNMSRYLISIVSYDKDQDNVEQIISNIRTAIQDNKKNFYYSPFITPVSLGPLLPSEFGNNKVFQRNQDCEILFVYET